MVSLIGSFFVTLQNIGYQRAKLVICHESGGLFKTDFISMPEKKAVPTFDAIMRDLKDGHYAPIYLLMGDESYYIDKISDYIQRTCSNPNSKPSIRRWCSEPMSMVQ